jgi:dTDP-4-amino-4,6-dideoxygalactose transaminase
MTDRPAILGGPPAFPEMIDIVRPGLPGLEEVSGAFAEVLANGKITNNQRYLRALEAALAERIGRPVVATANGTLGLILLLKALGARGEVVLPSFTFAATAHAADWAGLRPRFADIDPETWTLDPGAAARACTRETAAILPVHVFGLPCDADALSAVAREAGVPLLFDAAHGFGAGWRGRAVGGLGDAEVFSFHATKIFGVGEGGAVCTDRSEWRDGVAAGRNFGLEPDGDCRVAGTNAKMSELFAIIGLRALEGFEGRLARRRRAGERLRERVGKLPGVTLQRLPESAEPNHQNFAVLIDRDRFGLDADEVRAAMDAENIMTRRYFHPPLHRMACYRDAGAGALPETDRVADRVLCLPIYNDMTDEEINAVAGALERIHDARKAVAARLRRAS